MVSTYKFIDHTADIAVEVSGSTYAELFLAAVEGWKNSVMDPGENVAREENKSINLEEDSAEELLVTFLQELNYLFDSRKIFPAKVHDLKISENNNTLQLKTKIGFCKISDTDNTKNEIKAITYHQLDIKKEEGLFKTIIVFDI